MNYLKIFKVAKAMKIYYEIEKTLRKLRKQVTNS